MTAPNYQAILFTSFGGPEGMEDVMPYLDNVLRGRNIPQARKEEVAHHYYGFGGVSPINEQNRALIAALEKELRAHGIDLPIYFGNRNWKPYIEEAVRQMTDDGVTRALAFVTSGYSCYSGCRQYRENIALAREAVGERAPVVDKIRVFYNHPLWVEVNRQHVQKAMEALPAEGREKALLLFTAHSIPSTMAEGSKYETQLTEASRLVAEALGHEHWRLVYQSRSGPPHQPWLEPDVCDVIETLPEQGVSDVIIAPIGFISDHMEVLYDLDEEAREACERLGIRMARAPSAGTHPLFIQMLRELIQERMSDQPDRKAIGQFGPNHDVCPEGCCAYERPAGRPKAAAG